ncbi:MAG: NAD(+) synthase, partial [Candidatus Dormibacteraceae bacterium]
TAEIYTALKLGIRDYFNKLNIFPKIVLGLSGGIDSSLAATLAVDAVGHESVVGILMPSKYTSTASLEDAYQLAAALRIKTQEIPIEGIAQAFAQTLAPSLGESEPGVTQENLQPRIRGALLMALNNSHGWLVLNAGNKSELATGYCTIYGDMVGGFNALKDIPKTLVFDLAHYRNQSAGPAIIPQRVLEKAPSAELRENQFDQDSLPPYFELDQILQGYVEGNLGPDELIAAGYDRQMVLEIIQLVDRSEWKRRQAAPGVKITPRAFGRDRRMPIVNRFAPLPCHGEQPRKYPEG